MPEEQGQDVVALETGDEEIMLYERTNPTAWLSAAETIPIAKAR
jgi:hypothetical protein